VPWRDGDCGDRRGAGRPPSEPLIVDATLTLSAAVDAALAAYPDSPTLAARRRQAEAWQDRGRSFLSARPALSMRVQSDRFGSDAGLQEYETGIELPLWSFGGRRAVRDHGAALGVETDAARSALRWEVAGLVRSALWNVALAEADLALAEKAYDTAARLARVVERRHELGDVAERTAQSGATVFVGTRRERPANGPQFDDSIGLVVSLPFGADSHRRTEISAAARRAAGRRDVAAPPAGGPLGAVARDCRAAGTH